MNMSIVRKALLVVVLLVVALLATITVRMRLDLRDPYPATTVEADSIPTFTEVSVPFAHVHDTGVLPFLASAVIDIDGDGIEEVFLGGGVDQQDGLLRFAGGGFADIAANRGLEKSLPDATYGAAVIDADADGASDLIVARQSGVYFYRNIGGSFEGRDLQVPFNEKTVAISVGLGDVNNDGAVDMYLSGYLRVPFVEGQNIFNKPGYGGTSLLLVNNGDMTFTDRTAEYGLEYVHNTFVAVFADVDEDGWLDLVVAHDTGQVRTWRNTGTGRFENSPNPFSDVHGYPMGIAAADYDNDGRVDFFFSNVGNTVPGFVITGDITPDQVFQPKWNLFRNTGNFTFDDTAADVHLADFEFSWGALFEDFNLDGLQDLAVSENYIGFPPHKVPFFRLPGRFLIQRPDGKFAAAEEAAGVANPFYSLTPLTADFNDDGYPDLLHVNVGGTTRAWLNDGGDQNYLKVRLPDTAASLGARVVVTTASGKTLTGFHLSGEGLSSDQSHVVILGLGGEAEIASVDVHYVTGGTQQFEAPAINTTLDVAPLAPVMAEGDEEIG